MILSKEKKNGPTPVNDELKKLMESMMKFKKMTTDEDLETAINEDLGEPHETQEYVEDGFKFQKMIWNTPHGQFIKVIVTDVIDDSLLKAPNPEKPKELSLEEQLREAVDNENYELAAKIRDQINPVKKTRKTKK